VSYWLGHTNVSTTSQYLRTTVERLRRAATLFEEARRIDKPSTSEEAA